MTQLEKAAEQAELLIKEVFRLERAVRGFCMIAEKVRECTDMTDEEYVRSVCRDCLHNNCGGTCDFVERGCKLTRDVEAALGWKGGRLEAAVALQRQMDIDKACEWLAMKGIWSGNTCGDLKEYIEGFRKAMEE